MNQPSNPADAFNKFWSDFAARMGSAGMMPQTPNGPDALKQMQRMYFDAMAKYADEYMRSPQFLDMLKQTMDASMAWKKQMDQWLTGTMKAASMPTAADANETIARLHSMEQRLSDRLEALEERLSAIEGDDNAGKKKRPGKQ